MISSEVIAALRAFQDAVAGVQANPTRQAKETLDRTKIALEQALRHVGTATEPPEDTAPQHDPEPDPVVYVRGMIPVYNPADVPVVQSYDGYPWRVRSRGVDLMMDGAAQIAVGAENSGGTLYRLGVRRLYAAKPEYVVAARSVGLTTEDWCRQRNERIRSEADAAWKKLEKRPGEDVEHLHAAARGIAGRMNES